MGAVVGAVAKSEYDSAAPWAAEKLRRLALTFLPKDMKERYDEEWQAHIQEIESRIGKLSTAFGFLIAALNLCLRRMRHTSIYFAAISDQLTPSTIQASAAIWGSIPTRTVSTRQFASSNLDDQSPIAKMVFLCGSHAIHSADSAIFSFTYAISGTNLYVENKQLVSISIIINGKVILTLKGRSAKKSEKP